MSKLIDERVPLCYGNDSYERIDEETIRVTKKAKWRSNYKPMIPHSFESDVDLVVEFESGVITLQPGTEVYCDDVDECGRASFIVQYSYDHDNNE